MTTEELFQYIAEGYTVTGGSPAHQVMHRLYLEANKLLMDFNTRVFTQEEITNLLCKLTGREVHPSVVVQPSFNTDCGKNIRLGKRIFINSGCKFQDQGGIQIGDDVLIGHNCVIATINHDQNPDKRADMTFAPVHIGNKVWIGSNVTILPGVTIGEGSIVAAGAVVNRDVAAMTIVGGVPAKFIKKIEQDLH